MADDPTQAGTQAEPSQQAKPQAGSSPTATTATGTQAEPTSGTTGSEPMSLDEAKKLRAESNSLRKRLAELETAQKAADDAKLTEAQKRERDFTDLQTRNLEMEARLQQQGLRIAGYELGTQLGISDIRAALALVQVEHPAEIKYSASGEPENLGDLLKLVLKDHPALAGGGTSPAPAARPGASSGGATNPGAVARPGATFTREQIARMSPTEYRANEKAIYDALRAGTIRP